MVPKGNSGILFIFLSLMLSMVPGQLHRSINAMEAKTKQRGVGMRKNKRKRCKRKKEKRKRNRMKIKKRKKRKRGGRNRSGRGRKEERWKEEGRKDGRTVLNGTILQSFQTTFCSWPVSVCLTNTCSTQSLPHNFLIKKPNKRIFIWDKERIFVLKHERILLESKHLSNCKQLRIFWREGEMLGIEQNY